jgi:NifB/MoaA-like Fe-S oxidoreductase
MRIKVNTQVVLCPDLNDGEHLDRTISDLAALRPGLGALSIVPVGLTDNGIRQAKGVRRHSPDEARALVEQVTRWRRQFRRETGESFVHASDEFYLVAGIPVPSARYYDGFAQYSNGVGMVRTILDEAARMRRREIRQRPRAARATVIAGALAAPVLAPLYAEIGGRLGVEIGVIAAENRFFGPSVTVSGLLTAGDIVAATRGRDLGEVVVVSRHALDADGERFLDDVTPDQLSVQIGRPIAFASTLRESIAALS